MRWAVSLHSQAPGCPLMYLNASVEAKCWESEGAPVSWKNMFVLAITCGVFLFFLQLVCDSAFW